MTCSFCSLSSERLRRWQRRVVQTAHLMVGLPDYGGYLAHCRQAHPEQPVMDRVAFFRERQESRYAGGSGRGFRCC